MTKRTITNLEQIINLEGDTRLDINVNYGLLLFIQFMAEQNGSTLPKYITQLFRKEYDKFIKENGSLYFDGEAFYKNS